MRRRAAALPAIGIALLMAPAGAARAQGTARAAPDRPTVEARLVETPPVIDGDVLGDPAFAGVEPMTAFVQNTPNAGEPASERTEVRVLYTKDALYFGVVCFDREPGAIVVSDSRRDSPLDETDSIQILLDTFLDGQNAFVFGTNPSGLEYDGQVVKEGEGGGFLAASRGGGGSSATGRQANTMGASFNLNWDGSWTVRTRTSEIGWTAEIAIPFRTLRYPAKASAWGLNIQRNIRRRNESAYWAALPVGIGLHRVSLAGRLTGLSVPVQRNLKVTPYALSQSRHAAASGRTVTVGDVGGDLKYSLTPSLTLDATYNTDFAQVEVDDEQVNLNRFQLFFPEKRPFFLENAGLFAVGNPGSTEVFFSRRIGISRRGDPIPIVGGGRISGTVGGTNVGVLNMQTQDVGPLTPATNFTVARVQRDLPNRSSIGALFTGRHATGRFAGADDHNSAYAVDGRIGTGTYGKFAGFAARTESPQRAGHEHAYDVGWIYEAPRLLLNLQYTEVGANFNPEVGFVSRTGFRQINTLFFKTIRLGPTRRLHEIRPHTRYSGFWNFAGFQETAIWHVDSHWQWKNGAQIDTGMNLTREGLVRPFEIYPGVVVPPGTYDHREAQIVTMTNQGAPVSFRMTTFAGGFFGGSRWAFSPTLRWRVGETFNTELSAQRNDIALPWGSFVTNLVRVRSAYSFTPRVFLQALVQYNDRADLWSMNFRFNWLQQANTGLFVVYNDTHGLRGTGFEGEGRSLTIKISRMVDVLR